MYKIIFQKTDPEKMMDDIVDYFEKSKLFCNNIIGQGYYGRVFTPGTEKKIIVPMANKENISIPVVIKMANNFGQFRIIDGKQKTLLISTDGNIVNEAIALNLLSDLYYNGITPHVPFMVSAFSCENQRQHIVDTIVSQYNILYDSVIINHKTSSADFDGMYIADRFSINNLYKMSILIMNNEDDVIDLPSGIKMNVIEFADYLFVSLTYTLGTLWKRFKMNVADMQKADNIFLQSTDCFYINNDFKKYTHMSYKLGDKYLTMPNFGIVPKLGDLGLSTIITENIIICEAHNSSIINNYGVDEFYDFHNKELNIYTELFDVIKTMLQFRQFSKTCVGELLNKKPYSNFISSFATIGLDKWPTNFEILKDKVFDKYVTKNVPAYSLEISS